MLNISPSCGLLPLHWEHTTNHPNLTDMSLSLKSNLKPLEKLVLLTSSGLTFSCSDVCTGVLQDPMTLVDVVTRAANHTSDHQPIIHVECGQR